MPEGSAARKFLPAVDWKTHWPRISTWPGLRPEPTAAWRTLCEAWPADCDRVPLSAAYRILTDRGSSLASACRRIQALLREGLAVRENAPSSDPCAGMVAWLILVDPATIEEKRPRWHRRPPRIKPGDRQAQLFEDGPALLSLYTEAEMAEIPEAEKAIPLPLCAQEPEAEMANANPGGETPRTPAGAPPHAPSTKEYIPSTSTAREEEIKERAIALCGTLWPQGRGKIADRRDQRLIYRLALLSLDNDQRAWLSRLVHDTADARPKSPLGMIQARMPVYAPAGTDPGRLLASIDVPRWALADVRDWCPNGHCLQRE